MDFNENKIRVINEKCKLLDDYLKQKNTKWFLNEKIIGNFSFWLNNSDQQCIDIALIDMISISMTLPEVFAREVLISTHNRLRDSSVIRSRKVNAHHQACFMIAECLYLGKMTKKESIQ
jgi:hypothetical protein